MSTAQKTLAIQAALSSNWKDAVNHNEELVTENPLDLDSLNRLGFAYMKLGRFNKSKEAYRKVIAIDKTNPIAVKNLKRLETVAKGGNKNTVNAPQNTPSLAFGNGYIEEAGKTKTVELKNVADKKTLSFVEPGDSVSMVIKRSKIFVQTMDKKYIGMLPDNISMRLIAFIKGGNEYASCVKASDDKTVMIFIRETKKSGRFKNQASFIASYAAPTDSE